MEITGVIIAAVLLGGLGLVFGAVLSIVGQKFAVVEKPLRNSIREALPGANCGACGFPGCDSYADAIVEGNAPVNKCPTAGEAFIKQIGELMGIDVEAEEPYVATVMCRGDLEHCGIRFDYRGPKDCRSASLAAEGDKTCHFSCLGLGNCEKICPFGAITIGLDRLAVVDEEKCVGCGLCVNSCPRNVLQLLPLDHPVHRMCSAMERGKIVRDHCTAGCVGCGKCERSCKFGALKMANDLPEIDLSECRGCMRCADDCPTGALRSNERLRKRAVINYKNCNHCERCLKACPFDAIIRNEEGRHSVVAWDCTGCGECLKVCGAHCIQLAPGIKYNR